MAYFPHNQEDEFENPRLNRFEDNYPVSKSRNYSPDNKDKITQRIIRYFEDPKEAKALAEIKKLSNKAKKSSKNVRSNFGDFIGTDDLKNNTELNRVMFKNEGNDYELEQPNVRDPFTRRKFKFSTQRYAPKNKNMTLIDEIRNKQNENNNDEDNTHYKHKNNRIIRFSIDNGYDNNNDNKEANNINKNYNNNTSKPESHHASNFRKYKKLKSENITRPRFGEKKPDTKSINDGQKKIEIMEGAFDNIPDEYKAKNHATVENLHNKEQIVINEYHTKNKNAPKNYKTEYVWDKSINRLVEKRIYLDKNEINNDNNNNNNNDKNEGRKYNNNSVNYRNRYKRFDDEDDNRNKKVYKPENEEKDEKEEKRKINLKYNIGKEYKDKDINKNKDEDEDNKIGERKRFDNSSAILNKEMKNKIEKEEKERDSDPNQNNVNKGNRFYRRYRNYKTENKEEEKPKEVEIVIEKKTIVESFDKTINETRQKEKEKESPNTSPNRRIYKKRINNLVINKNKNENENNDKKPTEPSPKVEHKYSKRPYYKPIEDLSKTIYTKKIISEETIPKKEGVFPEKKYEKKINKYEEIKPFEFEEKVEPEKKFEKKEGKVSRINPYTKYKKKNIKIKALQDEVDDEIEDKKPKVYNNTAYSNYIKNKGSRNDKHKAARTTSELIEDLEKIENYNVNTYLKNDDLLEIYDNINDQFNDFKNNIFYTNINSFEVNVGEFDKYKIPFLKKKKNAEDLCKGRVTSEDIYRKYSQNAKKYEKKKLFE